MLSCKRQATSCTIPPANLASHSRDAATKNPPAPASPPPWNIRRINSFRARNQITAPTVQSHVRQFVLNLFRIVANLLLYVVSLGVQLWVRACDTDPPARGFVNLRITEVPYLLGILGAIDRCGLFDLRYAVLIHSS
jgi:hypothetical protein